MEIGASLMMERRHRVWHLIVGLVLIGGGIVALAWPSETFLVLARVAGWVLLIVGITTIMEAFAQRHLGIDGWWLPLVIGVASVLIAMWAVRYPGRSIALLVLWVGITALARGIELIVVGFNIRSLREPATSV
jgi:uncharacterized membrane protein HdeD (DUF308 family)